MNPISEILGKLPGFAQNAAKPEKSEPGPGDVGPTTQTKVKGELVTLPMTEEELKTWWGCVERARARVKAREGKWDILLKEYQPTVVASGTPEAVKVNRHFRDVHSKIGQLFYRSPDLVMTPKDPSPAQNMMPNPMGVGPDGMPLPPLTMEDVISVKQAVLTEKLGRDGLKANRLMDELLFDVLAWAGIGCCKVGYRAVFRPVPQQPDPNTQPANQMLGLMPPQAPPVQVPVFEEWYARRFSPKKLLFNDDLRSCRFDEDGTWLGMEFFMSPKTAMTAFGLTEEEAGKAASDDRVFEYEADKTGSNKAPGLVHGVEIWCKASIFTDEVHPQAVCQLVLIEGIKERPIVWRPSPDQEFGPDGKLTENSLLGFPIRVLTIRDLADSPYPESDSAFTNSGVKQLSTHRRQSVKLRDAAIGKYFADSSAFDEKDIDVLNNGEVGSVVFVQEGKLAAGADKIWVPTAQVHATADDYRLAELISRDLDETLGISANQAGATEDTVRSATETATVASAVSARNDKELSRVVDFYLDLARMVDQLLMRYADANEYIHITGADGARRMQMWNNQMISGKYLYDIAPDSQVRVDTSRDFQQTLNFYNLAAADPLFNRAYVLRRLARMRGMDPSKVIAPPTMAQPPHGGPAQAGAAVSQHTASNSGGRQNEPNQPNQRQEQVK